MILRKSAGPCIAISEVVEGMVTPRLITMSVVSLCEVVFICRPGSSVLMS